MDINKIKKTLPYGLAPESPEEAFDWLKANDYFFGNLINGELVYSESTFKTSNPANGQFLAKISSTSNEDIDKAVSSAKIAYHKWVKEPPFIRAKYLYALARLIQKNSRLISVLETLDNGKPIRESRDIDVPLAARHFYYHAGWAQLLKTEFPDHKSIGPVAQIIPWNFPLLMIAWKIAPALASGNTVILKPADLTPLTAAYFSKLCLEANIPPGVVNIIHGDGTVGAYLAAHEEIKKVAFTGSTRVGQEIRKSTAGQRKSLTLELGGKSPFIVFEDADLDSAVEGVVDAIWFNQGEVCCAGSRLLVQEGVESIFIKKLKTRMSKLRTGNPLDKSTDIGAITSKTQLKKIKSLITLGKEEGATVYQANAETPGGGLYIQPTLITDVHNSMRIAQEEIFGPVLVVISFRTPFEAVEVANNSRYGLSASIWTENINLALDLAPKVKAGVIWINSTNLFDAGVGFGGVRESGFGREGGREGMLDYLLPKPTQNRKKQVTKKQSRLQTSQNSEEEINRTRKLYINGHQVRPDGGYVRKIMDYRGNTIGQVPEGNRKDVRNAVEAAKAEKKWTGMSSYNRAQILFYLAENLSLRRKEYEKTLMQSSEQRGKEE